MILNGRQSIMPRRTIRRLLPRVALVVFTLRLQRAISDRFHMLPQHLQWLLRRRCLQSWRVLLWLLQQGLLPPLYRLHPRTSPLSRLQTPRAQYLQELVFVRIGVLFVGRCCLCLPASGFYRGVSLDQGRAEYVLPPPCQLRVGRRQKGH